MFSADEPLMSRCKRRAGQHRRFPDMPHRRTSGRAHMHRPRDEDYESNADLAKQTRDPGLALHRRGRC